MAGSNITQSSFNYGELSPEFYGASESEFYNKGLSVLTNFYVRDIGSVYSKEGSKLIYAFTQQDDENLQEAISTSNYFWLCVPTSTTKNEYLVLVTPNAYYVVIEDDDEGTPQIIRGYDKLLCDKDNFNKKYYQSYSSRRDVISLPDSKVCMFLPSGYITLYFDDNENKLVVHKQKMEFKHLPTISLNSLYPDASVKILNANYINDNNGQQFNSGSIQIDGVPIDLLVGANNVGGNNQNNGILLKVYWSNKIVNIGNNQNNVPIENLTYYCALELTQLQQHVQNNKFVYLFNVIETNLRNINNIEEFIAQNILNKYTTLVYKSIRFSAHEDGTTVTHATTFGGRLYFVENKTNTIYASSPNNFCNFTVSPEAGVDLDIRAGIMVNLPNVKSIKWIIGGEKLFIGTSDGIYCNGSSSITGADNALRISQSTLVFNKISYVKCGDCSPIKVGDSIFFVGFDNTSVYELSLDEMTNAYKCYMISKTASHMLQTGISNIGYSLSPSTYLACLLTNGTLAIMGHNKANAVYGWSRFILGGEKTHVQDMFVGSYQNRDRLYCIVRRYNPRKNKYQYTLEYIQNMFNPLSDETFRKNFCVDCGITQKFEREIISYKLGNAPIFNVRTSSNDFLFKNKLINYKKDCPMQILLRFKNSDNDVAYSNHVLSIKDFYNICNFKSDNSSLNIMIDLNTISNKRDQVNYISTIIYSLNTISSKPIHYVQFYLPIKNLVHCPTLDNDNYRAFIKVFADERNQIKCNFIIQIPDSWKRLLQRRSESIFWTSFLNNQINYLMISNKLFKQYFDTNVAKLKFDRQVDLQQEEQQLSQYIFNLCNIDNPNELLKAERNNEAPIDPDGEEEINPPFEDIIISLDDIFVSSDAHKGEIKYPGNFTTLKTKTLPNIRKDHLKIPKEHPYCYDDFHESKRNIKDIVHSQNPNDAYFYLTKDKLWVKDKDNDTTLVYRIGQPNSGFVGLVHLNNSDLALYYDINEIDNTLTFNAIQIIKNNQLKYEVSLQNDESYPFVFNRLDNERVFYAQLVYKDADSFVAYLFTTKRVLIYHFDNTKQNDKLLCNALIVNFNDDEGKYIQELLKSQQPQIIFQKPQFNNITYFCLVLFVEHWRIDVLFSLANGEMKFKATDLREHITAVLTYSINDQDKIILGTSSGTLHSLEFASPININQNDLPIIKLSNIQKTLPFPFPIAQILFDSTKDKERFLFISKYGECSIISYKEIFNFNMLPNDNNVTASIYNRDRYYLLPVYSVSPIFIPYSPDKKSDEFWAKLLLEHVCCLKFDYNDSLPLTFHKGTIYVSNFDDKINKQYFLVTTYGKNELPQQECNVLYFSNNFLASNVYIDQPKIDIKQNANLNKPNLLLSQSNHIRGLALLRQISDQLRVTVDGKDYGDQLVKNNVIILDTVNFVEAHIGFNFTKEFCTLDLSGGAVKGSSVGAVVNQIKLSLRLFNSGGGEYAAAESVTQHNMWTKIDYSGIKRSKSLTMKSTYSARYSSSSIMVNLILENDIETVNERFLYIRSKDALPLNILSITRNTYVSDN